MGFFDIFRRAPAIRETRALADFIDRNAAFLIQKGMYEYSRARAGHYAKVLMREPEFLEAIEKARWQGFPLGLAMVGEMVEGVLRSAMGEERRAGLDGLVALVLSVFDRYPVPPPLKSFAWEEARADLKRIRSRRPAPAQTREGHSDPAGGNLFWIDADPRKAARPGFPGHPQLSAGFADQHP